jgi:hypothetical protein
VCDKSLDHRMELSILERHDAWLNEAVILLSGPAAGPPVGRKANGRGKLSGVIS